MLGGIWYNLGVKLTSNSDEHLNLYHGDCLEVMPTLADNSVDLVLTDPPYYKVKGDAWDRQWDKPELFLSWMDDVLAEFWRVLKPNGSLYVFASPQMSARVEMLVGERFEVLNNVRWLKEAGWHQKQKKDDMRKFSTPWECCIFAEHKNAESYAKGEAGYAAKCDELRGFVFEPLRSWFIAERDRAGLTRSDIAQVWRNQTGSKGAGITGHFWDNSQWELPTEKNYNWLRETVKSLSGDSYYGRPYTELRTEYEQLRRPFNATPDRPYTDVWTYKTVQAYKGKHPCEKPQDMLQHIIETSSKPGGVVLDAFMGTASTGLACQALGREFIGIEKDQKYFQIAKDRINNAKSQMTLAV